MNYISEEKCIEYTGLITSWSDVSVRRLIKKNQEAHGPHCLQGKAINKTVEINHHNSII